MQKKKKFDEIPTLWTSNRNNRHFIMEPYLYLVKKAQYKINGIKIQMQLSHFRDREAQCHYNAVNFLWSLHNRQPIARPLEEDIGCLLWIQILVYVLPQ